MKVAQAKTSELTKNWEGKVEEFIAEGRAYVAIAGNEVRRVIDLGAAKSGEIINQVKNYDYGSSVEQVKSQLGSVAEQVTSKSADFTVELGDKLGVYYQQALDATGKITLIESMIASIWCNNQQNYSCGPIIVLKKIMIIVVHSKNDSFDKILII